MTDITWASGADLIKFNAVQVSGQSDDQVIPGSRVNSAEIDRLTRKGSQPVRFSDFSGGLTHVGGIGNVKNNLNQYGYNQGLVTRIPGALLLPYNPTIQTSITSEQDISAFIAANKRLHALNSAVGDTALRWLFGLGINVFGDTSGTNPAVVQRFNSGSDYVTAAANLFLNSTNYAAFAFRNVADATGVTGRSDVSGSGAGTGTQVVALGTAGDTIWGMQYMGGLGPSGANIFTGAVAGVNQLYYALGSATIPAALQPVVDTSSKSVEGSLAVVTVGPFLPTSYGQDADNLSSTDQNWLTMANLLTSDNTYATSLNGTNSAGLATNPLILNFGPQFSAVPLSAIIKGFAPQWELKESATNDDIVFRSVKLMFDGTVQGNDRADGAEVTASDAVYPFGGTNDNFGLSKTGADLASISTRLMMITVSINGSSTVSADTGGLTVTYRMPGTALKLNEGGWAVAPHPLFPNRFAYVEPAADDKTAITQPRRLCFVDCEWDAAGNRPTGSKSYPSVGGLAYIHHVVPFLGGYLITGSNSSGPGDRVVFLKGDGTTFDYQFPGFMGSTQFKVNALYPMGIYFAAQVVASDFSDLQYWLFDTTRNSWFCDTILQSKTATAIALQPIPYAEVALGLQQNMLYSIFPLTTHTAARREFFPADPNQDPRQTNTSQTKYASALYLQTMEMEAGYPDASNTIVRLDYQERRIGDASSATGTVKVEIETGGDATVASPAISNTFTTGHSATPGSRGRYEVPLSGQAYQTFITRLTLDQGSGTTTSGPNGLNVLVTTAQEWAEDLRVYEYQLAPDGHSKPDILALLEEFERVKTKKNVQPLKGGSINCNASYVKVVRWETWQGERGSPEISANQVQTPVIQFAERLGTV